MLPRLVTKYSHVRLHEPFEWKAKAELLRKAFAKAVALVLRNLHRRAPMSKPAKACFLAQSLEDICENSGPEIGGRFRSDSILPRLGSRKSDQKDSSSALIVPSAIAICTSIRARNHFVVVVCDGGLLKVEDRMETTPLVAQMQI